MKIISKKNVKLAVWILIAATLLGGCVEESDFESQEEALVQASLPAINEFLAEHCGEYELGELHMDIGVVVPENSRDGYFGSNVIIGKYSTVGNTWNLAYDRETGEFYTDELLGKLRKQEESRILEYLKDELPEEDLRDFKLNIFTIYYQVQSHDIKIDSSTTADICVTLWDMLPAGVTEADLPEFAARSFDGGVVTRLGCEYYSDRADALTKKAFEQFFTDNPAYQVGKYVQIDNENPSAKEEQNTASSETGAQNVPRSTGETWFYPEPVGKDADCKIEYENGVIFARRPHFTESGGIVTMQFNAIDWYCVRVIRIEDVEKYFPDEDMLAQSSDLKVFWSYENQEFEYSCVFVPYDDSDFAFLFETDISPEARNFGHGFSDCIHYYAGSEEVFPDKELDRSVFENTGM